MLPGIEVAVYCEFPDHKIREKRKKRALLCRDVAQPKCPDVNYSPVKLKFVIFIMTLETYFMTFGDVTLLNYPVPRSFFSFWRMEATSVKSRWKEGHKPRRFKNHWDRVRFVGKSLVYTEVGQFSYSKNMYFNHNSCCKLPRRQKCKSSRIMHRDCRISLTAYG